jgi:hypothetical protein
LQLIEAIAQAGDFADPKLDPLYDEAIRDTVERFEATGSPIITDGQQRKYHNFWTYSLHGLHNTAPDGFKIPFSAGHVRRMPRLTAGPFRYRLYADRYLDVAKRYAHRPLKQAVISPSALSPMYPAEDIPGYSRQEFIDDLLREHETEIRRCFDHKLDPRAARAVSDNASLVDRVSSEIRTLSYLLHPPLLEIAGLATALRWYVDGFSERSKIKVDLSIPDNFRRLPEDAEIAIFRIIQECLTNIHRHSGSPMASISIRSPHRGSAGPRKGHTPGKTTGTGRLNGCRLSWHSGTPPAVWRHGKHSIRLRRNGDCCDFADRHSRAGRTRTAVTPT